MEKISVIVPVYNVENYIHRCVNSILNQTFTNFELILVNDGSPDNCGKICDEYAKNDNRIHVIHQKNSGQAVARNVGIEYVLEKSKSDWVIFIDSDDWVAETLFESLYKAVTTNKTDIAACNYYKSNTDIHHDNFPSINSFSPEEFYLSHPGLVYMPVCKLIKTELLKDIRFPAGKIFEDACVIYKIIFSTKKIAYINEQLYCYNINNVSTTRSDWTPRWLTEIEAHEEHIDFFKNNNYKKAYSKAIDIYLWVLYNQYQSMIKSEFCAKKYKKFIINKAKNSLKLYYPQYINYDQYLFVKYWTRPLRAKILELITSIKLKFKKYFNFNLK